LRTIAWIAAVVVLAAAALAARSCASQGHDVAGAAAAGAGDATSAAPLREVPRAHVPAPLPFDAVRANVRSMKGEPIAGAVVALFRGPESGEICDEDNFRPSAKPGEAVRTVAADAGGAALFDGLEGGRWFVAAWAPGYGRRTINVTRGARGTDADVLLAPGGPFTGSLRDDAGAPLPGVDVILAPTQRSMVWPSDAACVRTSTDAAGVWRFDAVAPGEYRVWVRGAPEALVDEGRVRVPSLDRFDIRLVRGASVEGVVIDADTGRALPGARVEIRSDDYEVPILGRTACDAAGRFSYLTHLAETDVNSVGVDAGGYAPIPVDGSGEVHPKTLRDGQTARLVVRVRRGFTVTGVVTGPEGPVEGADVAIVPERESDNGLVAGRRERTDAEGRYRFERVPAGSAEVNVDPFGPHRDWRIDEKASVTVGDAAATTVDFTVAATRVPIEGRVVDRDGDPIAGARVSYEAGPLGLATTTGADGRYAMSVWIVNDQEHPRVEVRADGFALGGEDVPVDGGRVDDIVPRPLDSDHGTVLDADGNPVANARVVVESGEAGQDVYIYRWPGAVEAACDTRGRFEVTASTGDEGLIHPYAPADGTAWNWRRWSPDPDAPRDIRLRRVVRARGRVVATGTHDPVANALVRYSSYANQDDPPAVGRTDADGRFDVPFEPSEEKEVHALRVEADGFVAQTVTPGDGDLTVELEAAFEITGTLVGADGRPIAVQDVTARQAGVQDDVAASDTCTTDSDGRFVFRSLPAGRYELSALAKSHEFEDVVVEVVAGTRDVVLAAGKPAPGEPKEEKKPEPEPQAPEQEK
jgi:protocatechuate 3,4-dioxygenase beta subunit